MKNLAIISLLTFLPLIMFAQKFPKRTFLFSSKANIDVALGELTPISSDGKNSKPNIIKMELTIQNGEMVIPFNLAPLEEGQYYMIDLQVNLDGNPIPLTEDQLRGIGSTMNGGEKKIIWINPLERYPYLEGEVEVTLIVALWEDFNCDQIPTFTSKQRLPYYVVAGVGASSIGLGQLFKAKRDEIHANNYITSNTEAEADPYYQDLNRNHHAYLILTWTGSAILVADAVFYMIRQSRHNKRLKEYKENCDNNPLSLKPIITPPSLLNPHGHAGFRLTFNF